LSNFAGQILSTTEIEHLEETIIVLEAQRPLLGDMVTDTAVAPLRRELTALQERQDSVGQQRKFVTILFADMTGSTALSQRLELEEMMTLTEGAIGRFNRIIERRGGRVLKIMGDGLMAVFGLPQVQEDDAERAVQAGLDILTSAKIYAQVLEEERGIGRFNVRVGVNTGSIIMGGGMEEERTAIGMTVNLASRMESTAPEGALRITHATYQQVRGLFEVDRQPLLQVKGMDQPLLTYLVKARRPRSFRMDRYGIRGIKTPLIGRQAEIKQLRSLFKDTVQKSKAQIITIVGDPGIGKSRLMVEFETWLSQQPALVHCFRGRGFRPLIDSPYGVLRMLFAHYCQIHDNDELEVVRNKLEEQLTHFFIEDSLMKTHFIGALLGYNFNDSPYLIGVSDEPQQFRDRALHYLMQFYGKATNDGLTVILIEDLHWADGPTLELLLNLVRSNADKQLLIVCLARPELIDRHPSWFDEPDKSALTHTRLDLLPLSEAASYQMVSEMLHQADIFVDELAQTIVGQADGNPLYIEELIRVLIDNAARTRLPDDWDGHFENGKILSARVPDTLAAVMLSRLANLPPAEKTVLEYASVAGRSFWVSLVGAVSGKNITIEDHLASLAKRDLIYPKMESTFAGEHEYAFKHTLLREAIYGTILLGNRQIYHGRVAAWLKATTEAGGREDEFALVIAEHYDLAEMPGPAADFYLRGGEKARDQGAPLEALRSLDRALDLMGKERTDRQWQALLAKEWVLGWLGKLEERQASSQLLVEQAQRFGDDDRLAEALCRLGFATRNLGRFHDEAQAYQTALAAARRSGNFDIEARILALLAVCLLRLGRINQAQTIAQNALLLVPNVVEDNVRAQILTNIASFYSDSGDVAKATRLFSEIVDICSRNDIQYGEAINRINLGYNYTRLGLPELATETLEEAIRLTQGIGAHHNHAYCQLNLGLAYVRSGEFESAEATLNQALADLESSRDQFGQASGNLYLGYCLEQTGVFLAADDRYKKSLVLFREIGTPGYIIDASSGVARCFLANNDLLAAGQLAVEISNYLQDNGSQGLEFPSLAYLSCIRVYEAIGLNDPMRSATIAGYADLMDRAGKIEDDAWRKSFLQNVPEHQALIKRQESLAPGSIDGANDRMAAGREKDEKE